MTGAPSPLGSGTPVQLCIVADGDCVFNMFSICALGGENQMDVGQRPWPTPKP